MKGISIFYKSFSRDFHLLYVSLNTLEKNITGYSNIVIVIPEHEKDLFDTRKVPPGAHIHYVPEHPSGNGYLWQQAVKANAHKYCSYEFILFADSDCIWNYKLDLQQFVEDGKPEILYTSWDKVGDAICWKAPTERVMGGVVIAEFMRRNSMIYYRSTLEAIEKWKPDLQEYIMQQQSFSEFNFFGAWAYKYEREKYNFVDTDTWAYVPPKSEQVWSLADKNGDLLHVKEWVRLLEAIMTAYNVPIPQ